MDDRVLRRQVRRRLGFRHHRRLRHRYTRMSNADSAIRPVPGPRWTRKRLIGMLTDCYGPTPRGAVNVAAVAAYAGVSPSTVRRWIARGQQGNRRKPAIPKHRITQLQRGPEVVERRN